MRKIITLSILLVLSIAFTTNAQPVIPNPLFADCGTLTTTFPGNGNAPLIQHTFIKPGGKILSGGYRSIPFSLSFNALLAQYHSDGSPDLDFGVNGQAEISFNTRTTCHKFTLQPNGKIIVVGVDAPNDFSSEQIPLIFRLNENGTVDNSFGASGRMALRFDNTSSGFFNNVHVLPDGKILAGGVSAGDFSGPGLMKFNADGSLDESFGNVPGYPGRSRIGRAYFGNVSMIVLADGKILLAYSRDVAGNGSPVNLEIVRFLADGTVDISFGTNGTLVAGVNIEGILSSAVQPDGKIIFSCTSNNEFTPATPTKIIVLRYFPDFTPDASFGNAGYVELANLDGSGISFYNTNIGLQPDGKILLSGARSSGFPNNSPIVIRLNANGQLDAAFNNTGYYFIPSYLTTQSPIDIVALTDNSCIVSNADNFRLINLTTEQPAPTAGALNFDGTDDVVQLGNWFNNENFSVELWIKPGATQTPNAGVMDNGVWQFYKTPGSVTEYYFNINGSIPRWLAVQLTLNTWQHITLVKNGTSASVYKDGVLASTTTLPEALPYNNNMMFLGRGEAAGREWNGTIDELRFWNRPLTQTEIQSRMNCELSPTQTDLLAYYKFHQGFSTCNNTGVTSLIDNSGNDHNGSLSNFSLSGANSNWVEGNVTGICGQLTTYYQDLDGDGFGDAAITIQASNQPLGYVTDNTDCNDDPDSGGTNIYPGATEICNGIDDDCDGQTDEGVTTTFYQDADGDGYGNLAVTTQVCTAPSGYVSNSTDCNDNNNAIHPGATEVCGNGIDENCNGQADEGCLVFKTLYRSIQTGNWNNATTWEVSYDQGVNWITTITTPNAADSIILIRTGHTVTIPVSVVITADEITTDNNGSLQINGQLLLNDGQGTDLQNNGNVIADGSIEGPAQMQNNGNITHGVGIGILKSLTFTSTGAITVTGGELNFDLSQVTNTGAVSIASGAVLSTTATTLFKLNTGSIITGSGILRNNSTMEFNMPVVLPNTLLYDVDGLTSGSSSLTIAGTMNWKDGPVQVPITINAGATINVNEQNRFLRSVLTNNGTMNWGNANIRFQNGVIHNYGVVNAANTVSHEMENFLGTNAFNNYGSFVKTGSGNVVMGVPFTNTGTLKGNGAISFPNNNFINNGTIAPGLSAGILSIDRSPFTSSSTLAVEILNASGAGTGYDRLDVTTNVVLNGILQITGNASIPNGNYTIITSTGSITGSFSSTQLPLGYTGAIVGNTFVITKAPITDVCNGIDDDDDGQTDEDAIFITYYLDQDGDGYGNHAISVSACQPQAGYVTNNTDCNDGNAAIYPGATEVCNNADDDCDGLIDEGVLATFFRDADSDGFGNAAVTSQACSAPTGYVSNSTDCNDANSAIYPGATEICGNTIDDNCNGQVNEGCNTSAIPNWTWINGSDTIGAPGIAASSNTPGARQGAITWTDALGNLWLMGGVGLASNSQGFLNDLWKYDHATNRWTWIKGSNQLNQSGIYGEQGIAAVSNTPGARQEAVSWTDASGNFLLMGGYGYGSSTNSTGVLNDLWKYNIVTNEWTWIKGSNLINQTGVYGIQGIAATSNIPGGRYGAVSWKDAFGKLWLMGGSASTSASYMNDLWKYDPATNQWTWMKGSSQPNQLGLYGTRGVAAVSNTPGARAGAVSWTDASGNLWLMGGYGNSAKNDLWKYNPATNQWAWMKGSSQTFQYGIYGAQGVAADNNTPGSRHSSVSWTDAGGNFWLMGGYGLGSTGYNGSGELNDLWKYNPSTNLWTWMKGYPYPDQRGLYGTQGVAAVNNTPDPDVPQ